MGITARIGVGWIVTAEQRDKMVETALANTPKIYVEDEFHFINGYIEDTNYFLGEWLSSSAYAGNWKDLEGFSDNFNVEDFMQKYTEILRVCGQDIDDWGPPKLYLINQVW